MLIALQEDIPIAHLMHASTIVQSFTRSFVLKKCRKGGATGPEMFMFWMYHARRFVKCRMALKKGLTAFVYQRRRWIDGVVAAWEECDERARRMPGEVTFLEFAACFVPREKKREIVTIFRRFAMRKYRDDWRLHSQDMQEHYENFFYIVTDTFDKVSTGCFQVLRQFLLDVLFPSKHRPLLWHDEIRVVDLLRTAASTQTSSLSGDPEATLSAYIRERVVEGGDAGLIQSIVAGQCCQMRLFPNAPMANRSKFPWFATVRSKVAIVESMTKRKEHAFEQQMPTSIQPHIGRSPRQRCIAELLNLVHDDWYRHRLFQGTVHVRVDDPPSPHPPKVYLKSAPKTTSPQRQARPPPREHTKLKAPVPKFKRRAAPAAAEGSAASGRSDGKGTPSSANLTRSEHHQLLVTRLLEENFVAPVRLVLRPQLPSTSHGRFFGSSSDPFPLMKRLMSASATNGVQL